MKKLISKQKNNLIVKKKITHIPDLGVISNELKFWKQIALQQQALLHAKHNT